jgi:hypothetical protein
MCGLGLALTVEVKSDATRSELERSLEIMSLRDAFLAAGPGR